MTKKSVVVALVVLVISLATIYFKIGPPPMKSTVRVITPPSIIASLPIWVAQKEDMFTSRNLDIEFISLSNSRLMVEAMLAGNADVLPAVSLADLATTGGMGNLALMKVKIYSHSRMKKIPPFESLLIPTGSPLTTLKDLEGKKIAVYPGSTAELAVKYFLKINNVDHQKIKFVKLLPPEHEPILLKGDVDAMFVYEPYRTVSLHNNKARELSGSIYASINEPSAIGTSAISRNFLNKNPEAAKKFLEAWNEAILFINNNPEDARQILADKLKLPKPVASSATWVDATTTDETDYDILRNTVESCKLAGIIPDWFILERDMVLIP